MLMHHVQSVLVVHAYTPNTQEVEDQKFKVNIGSKFEASLGYLKPYLTQKKRGHGWRKGRRRRKERRGWEQVRGLAAPGSELRSALFLSVFLNVF